MPPAAPAPSLREEFANAASHGLGFVLATAALPLMLAAGWWPQQPGSSVGAGVFALTMMLVFLASTVYHALPAGRAKQWLHRADHAAIFLFIAGSFTPFALHNLHTGAGAAGFAWLTRGRVLRCHWTSASSALMRLSGPNTVMRPASTALRTLSRETPRRRAYSAWRRSAA